MRWIIVGLLTLFAVTVCAFVLSWRAERDHKPVEKLIHLHGNSLKEVIGSLGQPDQQREFTMAECCDEFRVELHNTYRPGDPNASTTRIKELQWHRARYHIAVWLHQVNGQWVVLNTCRWQEGIVF